MAVKGTWLAAYNDLLQRTMEYVITFHGIDGKWISGFLEKLFLKKPFPLSFPF